MKNYILLCIVSVITGITAGFTVDHTTADDRQTELIEAYSNYYKATEELLDSLDAGYSWVDSYDPYDYYAAKDRVERLK